MKVNSRRSPKKLPLDDYWVVIPLEVREGLNFLGYKGGH